MPNDVETYNYKNLDDYVASIVDYIVEYITVTQSKCLVLLQAINDAYGSRFVK